MTHDLRHDDHPHPPEGVPERRMCNDKVCRQGLKDWFDETLLPNLTIRFWIGIFIAVGAVSGASWFVTEAALVRFELKLKGEYESVGTHRQDIAEIKQSIKDLDIGLTHSINKVLDNQAAIMESVDVRRK